MYEAEQTWSQHCDQRYRVETSLGLRVRPATSEELQKQANRAPTPQARSQGVNSRKSSPFRSSPVEEDDFV
jgi:hypothetical protein